MLGISYRNTFFTMLLLVTSSQGSDHPSLSGGGYIDEPLTQADCAFSGILKWTDVQTPRWNIIRAKGRVLPGQVLWGELPDAAIDIGEKEFLFYGGNGGQSIWDGLGAVREGIEIPLFFLSRGQGADLEIIFVVGRDQDDALPPAKDLLAVRALDTMGDSTKLRDQLIDAVAKPESSQLLWAYALRRLYPLEDTLDGKIGLLLDPRIQENSPYVKSRMDGGGGRLWYATRLLTRQITVREADAYHEPSAEERRTIFLKLLEVFETTPSAYMAETVLDRFAEWPAQKAEFSDQDWATIRTRVRAVLDRPTNPLNTLPTGRQAAVQAAIDRVMKEPNPFAPN